MLMDISIFHLKSSMEIIFLTYIDWFVIIKKGRPATKLITSNIYNNMFEMCIRDSGTSTDYNDKFETAAIKSVFGTHAYELKVSSTKSMTGHMLGAAGGVEAIVCAMALKDAFVPATIHYCEKD